MILFSFRLRLRWACAPFLSSAVVIACSSGSSSDTSPSTTADGGGTTADGAVSTEGGRTEPVVDDLDGFAEAYCAVLGGCCNALGRPEGTAKCKEQLKALPAAPFHASRALLCLDLAREAATTQNAYCLVAGAPLACLSVVGGTVGTAVPGAVCTNDLECADVKGSEVFCRRPLDKNNTSAKSGTCQALSRGKVGDTCTASRQDGGTYFLDDRFGAPPAATTSTFCSRADGLYCDVATLKCAPTIALGLDCSFDSVCSPGTRTCLPGPDPCRTGEICSTPSGSDNGKCVAVGSAGTKCTNGTTCVADARCALKAGAGTCATTRAPGQSCTSSDECSAYNGTCAGTCQGVATNLDSRCAGGP